MLLRRISQHVKSQDWFAVLVDFLIVVIGILMAFQITTCSSGREEKRIYDAALDRVVSELRSNLEAQVWLRKGIAKELPLIQEALEALRSCRSDHASLTSIETALVPLNSPYVLLFQTSALKQFLNNDAFLAYQQADAREALDRLLRRAEYFLAEDSLRMARQFEAFDLESSSLARGELRVDGPDDILAVMLSDNPLSPPLFREPELVLPLELACKDKAFLAKLYNWESDAFRISIVAGVLQPQLEKALNLLGHPHE